MKGQLKAREYVNELKTKRFETIQFLNQNNMDELNFMLSVDGKEKVWFAPEHDNVAALNIDDLTENDKFWIKKYKMSRIIQKDYPYLVYWVQEKYLVDLFNDLLNNGYVAYTGAGELLQSCIVCETTNNLSQCSCPCQNIYCSKSCQAKHH